MCISFNLYLYQKYFPDTFDDITKIQPAELQIITKRQVADTFEISKGTGQFYVINYKNVLILFLLAV